MKRLAIALLAITATASCSSTAASKTAGAPSSSPAASTPASVTPVPALTSSTMGVSTPTKAPTTASSKVMEAVGEKLAAKIAFYAIAKAAGMDDSAKMNDLAKGICGRIRAGKPFTVGPWIKNDFHLKGHVAAKVAVAAILFECPKYKSLIGS